jgi:predicted regulator of Ras-like GTPase activity (Roadblock/LC7/MglB family)
VDAREALDELSEISSQIDAAVLFRADGALEGATLAPGQAEQFVRAARALLDAAGDGRDVQQVEVSTTEGSVFVIREGERTIAATTGPEPTVGLVFYDLKSCLRSVSAAELAAAAKPKRASRRASSGDEGDAAA